MVQPSSPPAQVPAQRTTVLLALGLFALAAMVRFLGLGEASLWLDEVLTIDLARLPLPELWYYSGDPTPPLFYTVEKLPLLLSDSAWLLRAPSALFGALTVVVVFIIARRIGGMEAGLATGLVLALSHHNIEYGQEARAYALLGLCISVSALALVRLAMDWKPDGGHQHAWPFLIKWGATYALFLLASLYTHNSAIYFWLATQVFFLVWWWSAGRWRLPLLLYWGLLNGIVLLLWLPWLRSILWLMHGKVFVWLAQPTPSEAWATWLTAHGMPSLPAAPWPSALLLAAMAAGLWALRRTPALFALFAAALMSSSIGIWAQGFASTPIYMLRTILWGTVFSSVLIGLGLAALPRTAKRAGIVLLGVAGAFGVWSYFHGGSAESHDWKGATATFDAHYRPGDGVMICSYWADAPFLYYTETLRPGPTVYGFTGTIDSLITGVVEASDSGRGLDIAWQYDTEGRTSLPTPSALASDARLWLIDSHCRGGAPSGLAALKAAGWATHGRYPFKAVDLYQLVPEKGPEP